MKTKRIVALLLLILCCAAILVACGDKGAKPIEVSQDDKSTHYLVFKQNGNEILRLVVLEGETYEDLRPFFPTLTEDDQYRCFWPENATVWDAKEKVLEINAVYEKK